MSSDTEPTIEGIEQKIEQKKHSLELLEAKLAHGHAKHAAASSRN